MLNIQDELSLVAERLEKFRNQGYREDMEYVQSKIRDSDSANKEELYPRFDSLGRLSL